ncbi:MAG TPA: sporulation histidine kinase inhibitor Sda [Niallia sp.]|nr:sporulation histidine kinase inhibitor Sda [Niallia sp.]
MLIINTYYKSLLLKLDSYFIKLIEKELIKRNIVINK